MERTARELMRAIRGRRSQLAFARRLGYRANPITDWERGARFPTGEEAVRAASRAGIDVVRAFARFSPQVPLVIERGRPRLAPWLDQLRGTASIQDIAMRSGLSRYSISRWLRGLARPRLPDFLCLLDSISGRAPDWVAALVPIEQVPSLAPRFVAAEAARRAAFELPWTEAALRLLETRALTDAPSPAALIARTLRIPREEAESCLLALVEAGVVAQVDERYVVRGAMTVDTQGGAGALHRLKQHWSGVASARLATAGPHELFAYNVVSVSRADLERIRERLRSAFREVRAIVAASQPEEVAAVFNLQLLAFDPEAPE